MSENEVTEIIEEFKIWSKIQMEDLSKEDYEVVIELLVSELENMPTR